MTAIACIDLHSHCTASDGTLSPAELIAHAQERGLTHLALTDHDTVAGVAEALEAARGVLCLIGGIELSALWRNQQIHVVGLGLDHQHPALLDFVKGQRVKREMRAAEIARKLEGLGFAQALERTAAQTRPGAVLTRGNFARFIAGEGVVRNSDEAFERYLKEGRPAFVRTPWGGVDEAVAVIRQCGGLAVLAHPKRYELTNTRLRELIGFFRDCGGEGMEVASCQQRPSDRAYLAELCLRYGLLASQGSDFHSAERYRDLGLGLKLPDKLTPVWRAPRLAGYFESVSQQGPA
ncbi:MAG: PHP domain-containing protein [Succinivibrio sp.]|nr:PHP domain-containing protein [Succinivibrio sp.]